MCVEMAPGGCSSGATTNVNSVTAIIPVHDTFWRVSDGDTLAGYIDQIDAVDGIRYRARRLNVRNRRWVALGEYWDLETAAEALTGPPAG